MNVALGTEAGSHGQFAYVKNLIEELKTKGVNTKLFYFPIEKTELNGVKISGINLSLYFSLPSMRTHELLKKNLKDTDLFHYHCPITFFDYFIPTIKKLKLPLITTIHYPFNLRNDLYGIFSRNVIRYFLRFARISDRFIAISNAQKEFLESITNKPIYYIPIGVDSKKFSSGHSEIKEKYNTENLITYLGRISPEKGVKTLISAFIQGEFNDAKLLIVGKGPLLKLINIKHPNIIYTGYVSEKEKIEILRGTDIFVTTSFVEGMSCSLLEAMSVGCCVVATNIDANRDLISTKEGFLFEPRNINQLKEKLELLINDKNLILKKGKAARKKIIKNHDWKIISRRIMDVYSELL
jgi:glycosyltransferase involved in cell wall biosynthesis